MRILHTSDWHVGATIRGRSRQAEHEAVLGAMLDIVEDESVDLVVVAGDQFHTATPSATAESLVWRTLLGFVERGARVVVVAGNHDNAAKLAAVAPLLTRGGEIAVGAYVRSAAAGGRVRISTRAGDATVALVPFVSQRGIVKTADLLDRDAAQHAQAYAQRLRVVLRSLAEGFGSGDGVDLIVGHLTVVGTGTFVEHLGGGERLSQIFDYVVPPQAFPTQAHYVALGHLHQPHDVPGPAPLRYCGSPLHLDFGEVASARGVTIVDVRADGPARIRHRPLDGGFRLLTLRGTLPELAAQSRDLGHDVHVRAVVDEPPRAGLADTVRETVPQAVDVRIAEAYRGGSDEIEALDQSAVTDPAALFDRFLDAQGYDDARAGALFRRLLDDLQATGAEPAGGDT